MKQKIQVALTVAIVVAAMRTAYVLYERHSANAEPVTKQAPPLDADYYVVPRKLYPYDLKSARQLTQQPVWVKEGYRYTYYAYDTTRHHADFPHETGQLLPIQKLEIKDVVTALSPGSPDQRQLLAVFEDGGKTFAVPIGSLSNGNYLIYSDEMFYIQDPHDLYKHWPAEVWSAIAKREVKLGMDEIQADFAIGMGIPERSGDSSVKTVNYPNGGKPVSITFRNGKATEIRSGPA